MTRETDSEIIAVAGDVVADGMENDAVRVVVCIDDTDDLSKQTSTGAVAEALAQNAELFGGKVELDVTRHQLLLDPRVPYTSHNSAMAFVMRMPAAAVEGFKHEARIFVDVMRAPSSDPGLCVGVVPADDDPWLAVFFEYGRKAQREYIPQEEAFALAERIPWLSLEGLGGTNDGVVGALAGAALRLEGEDGRFRGKWHITSEGVSFSNRAAKGGGHGTGNGTGGGKGKGSGRGKGRGRNCAAGSKVIELPKSEELTLGQVKGLLASAVDHDVVIEGPMGQQYDDAMPVLLCDQVKPLLRHGTLTVFAVSQGDALRLLAKDDLDALDKLADAARSCELFAFDNDAEEFHAKRDDRSCANCLYRRVEADGFSCMKGVFDTLMVTEHARGAQA